MLNLQVDRHTRLRLLRREDAGPLYRLVQTNRDHLRPWLAWLAEGSDPDSVRDFVESSLILAQAGSALTFGVWHRGALVGVVDLHRLDYSLGSAEIGYWLDAHHQGRGIMTACVRALVDYAFNALGLRTLRIRASPANAKSRALALRLGFRPRGLSRRRRRAYHSDVEEVFLLTREEWRRRAQGAGEG